MKTSMIFHDGTEIPRGWCVTPDHYLTTFKLVMNNKRVHERLQSRFKIVKSEGLEVTIQSMKPEIVNEALALISQRDAVAIQQVTVCINHRSDSCY